MPTPRPLHALLLGHTEVTTSLHATLAANGARLTTVETVREAALRLSREAYDVFLVPVTLDEMDPTLLIDMIAALVPDVRKRILLVGRGRTEVLSVIASGCYASGFVNFDAPITTQWAIIERVALRTGSHDKTSPPAGMRAKAERPSSAHSLLRGVSMVGRLHRGETPESRRAPRPVSVLGYRPGA